MLNSMPAKYKLTSSSQYNSKNWNSQYWDLEAELSTFKDGSANVRVIYLFVISIIFIYYCYCLLICALQATDTYYLTPGSLGDLPTLVIYAAPVESPNDWYRELQVLTSLPLLLLLSFSLFAISFSLY